MLYDKSNHTFLGKASMLYINALLPFENILSLFGKAEMLFEKGNNDFFEKPLMLNGNALAHLEKA